MYVFARNSPQICNWLAGGEDNFLTTRKMGEQRIPKHRSDECLLVLGLLLWKLYDLIGGATTTSDYHYHCHRERSAAEYKGAQFFNAWDILNCSRQQNSKSSNTRD